MRTHRERIQLFFNLVILNNEHINKFEEKDLFSIFLNFAHSFIEDKKRFWELFKKVYDEEKILETTNIKINFEIFDTISLLRKIVDHPTDIRLYEKNKNIIKNSNYLKFIHNTEKSINSESQLFLTENYTHLNKNEKSFFTNFICSGYTGKFYFNSFDYEINFDTHQIIEDFIKYIDIYCENCIKIKNFLEKNKIKYLVNKKNINKNSKNIIKEKEKIKVYDFNDKKNPLYDESLEGCTLIIEKKEKWLNTQKKPRKKFILTYKTKDKKPTKREYGIKAKHKGCSIGKLINNLLNNNDKIILNNLSKIDSYSISQPDFLLISIYMFIKVKSKKHITRNYLSKSWFMACGKNVDNIKILEDCPFPWLYIEEHMPFDERINNILYFKYIHQFSEEYYS